MKKLLGVSIAAMLAVSPMLASAEGQVAASLATSGEGDATLSTVTATANTDVATTSYVKGAYNAIATEHNKVVTAVNNIVSDIDVTSDGTTVKANKSVAENLTALDTAVKNISDVQGNYQAKSDSNVEAGANETLHHLTAGYGVGANLKALDAQVYANETAIGTNTSNISTLTTAVGDANSGLTKGVADNASAITGLGTRLTTAEGDIDALETTMGTATLSTTTQNVTGAINELNTAIGSINTASANYATKLGVVATINNATASATIPVFGTWDSAGNETTTGNITVNSNVESAATNKYFGTLADITGTTQTDPTPAPATEQGD